MLKPSTGRRGGCTMPFFLIILLVSWAISAIAAEKVPLPPLKKGTAHIVSVAKAKLNARTIWPALSQREIDDITMRAKQLAMSTSATGGGKPALNIFCYSDEKCGELTLGLENAFESAHWTVAVRFSPSMIPPGMQASPKVIKTLATIDPGFGLSEDPEPEAIESITIGEKPQGRLE